MNNEQQELNESQFKQVKEGQAVCYFHKTKNEVFYNPVQEFNRDLSIAVLNTYSSINKCKKLRILEALAASGIRSMRYAKEIENCQEIIANDLDDKAVELIKLNIELNKVGEKVSANRDDAIVYMNSSSRSHATKFDCIDLDPYGSPSVFLDSAVRTVRSGGLLLVTATDAAVLCGNGGDACFTKYGCPSLRAPFCHELALRILLQTLNSHAIRYSKYIQPVLSLSIDFYFRLFVIVHESQLKAKESIANVGFFHVCCECHSFYKQDYGKSIPTNGNVKFEYNTKNSFDLNKCENCNGSLKMIGPIWTGKLHEKSFVDSVVGHVRAKNHNKYFSFHS
jgi:tRNA (guanine26-N2/guanine27-N2)-dimethyltransferase